MKRSCLIGALIVVSCALIPASATGRPQSVSLGAYVPRADESPSLIEAFAAKVGWNPVIVNSFKTFDQAPIYLPQLRGIREHGSVPMVTWEPQTSTEGSIALARIADGSYDGYLSNAAHDAAEWGKPLMIRFGQEMNGAWYPWSPAAGNPARDYIAAWRHVVRLFRREGARNVKWVWTPYVDANRQLPFKRFYPGDAYVDWAGLDGYNWGGRYPWQSFRELFASSYRQLLGVTSRPLLIGEVGCGENGGSKSRWLRQMLHSDLPQMPRFRAVVWFDGADPKGDLRIDTTAGALGAFRHWTNQPLYASSRNLLLQTPSRFARPGRSTSR